jgi:hypothetical protein
MRWIKEKQENEKPTILLEKREKPTKLLDRAG